jgi:hypothetical protein
VPSTRCIIVCEFSLSEATRPSLPQWRPQMACAVQCRLGTSRLTVK